MPYYAKSEDWLHQSALLLQARPSTTRITTRYHLKPARRVPKPKKSDPSQPTTTTQSTQPQQPSEGKGQEEGKPPRGRLILKTFDPCSGATLKYKTSKAAEVTRLIQMLGTLGRRMAGVNVADEAEDEVMADVSTPVVEGEGGVGVGSGVQTPTLGQTAGGGGGAAVGGKEQAQQQGGGGGKGKKKKGKR
ncbi:signal recognition particle 9 kDa protein-domain-containing protein [Parachaetomium inaequale]|uniref:Signal recognition particle 9 kDa protein-domain-containing protein n=1 Tax=Parachaetomium inaequale TaxID=2588326 RepID=A0AAN6SV03_9PEZI|nr:signal recognition particle 9 kDa protein-domain-containing protein [Parachaetomium inaequale]